MTDGPFRNAELSSRWKQYGKDLVSDATSLEERTAQACHSMIGTDDLPAISTILADIKAHAQRPQMDLDAISSMEALFESHPKSPLTDTLQKHLIANLRDQMPLGTALDQALPSTVADWIGITKNRLDEECIRARDLGDMNENDYRKGIERNRETFANINSDALCDALTTGDKRAFKQAQQKKTGVDEGPDE
ncbi:MAG: hypothetical protein ABJ388_17765 [Alphaproteobacteria bacterium]|jgi:hypothetical protein|uniref:Uncharacterized protein n=1 Tax=Hyphomonas atlantica TaxID=1280948 RepID=A0A356W9N1_9PROT|nr:hypothetical protein [Magnetovibrio sp.]MAY68623.1 hypothetical protein [Rhodospirillaceae bacterium]HBQ50327.1 hypothetical protein [Hyphomonas atlantica]|tara:strand:+ start:930 stop:1505 length:576 start_codon:yes stop_codon:yes gene_type:complete